MAAPAFVQYVFHSAGSGVTSNTSPSITITAGNTIIVFGEIGNAGQTSNTCTDTLGNTYTRIAAAHGSNGLVFGGTAEDIWYCVNAKGGTGTVTITFPSSGGYFNMWVVEASGIASQLAGNGTGNASGSNPSITVTDTSPHTFTATTTAASGQYIFNIASFNPSDITQPTFIIARIADTVTATFNNMTPIAAGQTIGWATGFTNPPSFTTQPTNQTVIQGQTATFTSVATGATSYQWSKNGVAIPGATSTNYTTPPTLATDTGSTFFVVATGLGGSTQSSTATLTVIPVVGLTGGGFQDALGNPIANGYILLQLSSDQVVSGTGQIVAKRDIKVPLDANGNVLGTNGAVFVQYNDKMSDTTSFYWATVYTASGEIAWGPRKVQVLSSPSPYPASNWTTS